MVSARKHRRAAELAVGGLIFCLLAGCGSKQDDSSQPAAQVTLSVPANTPTAGSVNLPGTQAAPEHGLQQTFIAATLQDPPDGQWLPESGLTKTGKSIGKLYEAVVGEWDKIAFVTPQGKKLNYKATITTDIGVVTIDLWPEIAPNHVRSFVALARSGYYDGLAFDRAVKREQGNGPPFECLEAGCPVGTGEPTFGSIGYWLKPEFNLKVTHEPGTIGAWHGEEVESAACKFYINLSKAEWMDGNFTLFGKVTEGLDVLQAIHRRPGGDDGTGERPAEPVIMRKVAISCTVTD